MIHSLAKHSAKNIHLLFRVYKNHQKHPEFLQTDAHASFPPRNKAPSAENILYICAFCNLDVAKKGHKSANKLYVF